MPVLDALLRFPLRLVIPLALMLFVSLISVFLGAYNFTQIDGQVEKEIHDRVVQLLTRTQGTLRNLSRKGDAGGMQLEISQLGSDPLVLSAALLDKDNQVMFATDYSLVGKNLLRENPAITRQRLDGVRDRHMGHVEFDQQRTSSLAFYPVELWSENSTLGDAAVGVLFLQYDLLAPQQRAHRVLLQQLIQFTVVIGIFSVLLWLMFHYSLTRRVNQLVESANRFGSGDICSRARLSGHDEIAQLGTAFDNMVDGMAKDRRRLADSEARMRAILDNVGDCIATTNDHGMIQTVNPLLEHIFGYQPYHVIGRHLSVLFSTPSQRLQDAYMADRHAGRESERHMTCEALGRRKDGSEVALEVTATDFDLDGERLFLWIMRDITERKKVDRLKNEFVSVVSHELRTPLTSIIGSLGLLNAGVMGQVSAQAQEMLSIAQNNGERLVRLINDILDVEKIESGQLAFSEQAVDLGEVTLQAVDANRGLGEKYAVSFVVEQPLRAAWVQGDADRLIQVLTNLLSNAAKYSPEHGVVRVGMARQNGFLRVWVRDQGPGIPEDFQDRIFEKFAQVDSSDTRQKDGTGLGLSIARSIVELHGGHIGFNSSSVAGTEFYFDLPEYRQQQATAS